MSAILEVFAPLRLGRDLRWLLGSTWVSNLGDGIGLAAGPLLVASQTHDPFLVSLAATLQWLPFLLFGLLGGALADRLDRKVIVVVVDLLRACVMLLLVGAIVTDLVSVWLVLVAVFLFGTAEVFADSSSSTLLPMLVPREDLTIANARMQTGFITMNQLAGPPLGAALFVAGAAWPFAAQALLVAFGALLLSRIALPGAAGDGSAPARLREGIGEALRWVLHHAAVRTLLLTILAFNLTFGAAWSVLVLYATQRLGLGEVGFGLLTTISAVGGLLGTACYGWITRRVSLGDIMRVGLVIETFTHLGLALTTQPLVAMTIFFVFGAHAFIWGTTSTVVNQRAVPMRLQGRVGSVNRVANVGSLVVGSAVGGLIARTWGVTAPFWFAFVGSALFVVVIWGQLKHIAHADDASA